MIGMARPTIEKREDGLRWLVVKDGWFDEMARLVNSGRVDGIELNSSKGTWPDGLEFLADVPGLRHLILLDLQEEDVGPIQNLTQLESLNLSTYATSDFDFARLPKLRKAFVEWRKQYRNLSACTNLEELYLNGFWEKDAVALRPLVRLSKLSIGDSRAFSALHGIEGMNELRYLGLFGLPKLHDLGSLESVGSSLEVLKVNQCRYLTSLAPVGKLRGLRTLILADCGKVASLRPVTGLPLLEVLYFDGDTDVVDGDLEFLRTASLKAVAFKNRRHYSLRREELHAFRP